MDKIPVLVVCGPTASGKTGLGVKLALRFGGEVVSADSMQVYRRLDIGTAKPAPDERQGVPHHMIDVAEPTESYSVARYCTEAAEVIRDISSRGRLPVIVGGTGLYIDHLLANTDFSAPGEDAELRERLMKEAEEKGNGFVHDRLKALDPEAAEKIHPNNLKRVIRAIELVSQSGENRSTLDEKSRRPSPYRALRMAIDHDREELYRRIDTRVDIMIEQGLVDEVRRELLPIRDKAPTAAQAIGYKEIIDFFDGRARVEEAVAAVKQNSRRYAKRQLTWLRRNTEINWLAPTSAEAKAIEITQNFLAGGSL